MVAPRERALNLVDSDAVVGPQSDADEYRKFITSRIHNFVTFSYVMPLVYEYSDRSPTRAFNQATATQDSHHVVLQALFYKAAKTERTYKYNRTATAVVQV